MFSGWFDNPTSKIKVGFDDVKHAIQNPTNHIIINTMPADCQECLIKHTMAIDLEERIINDYLQKSSFKGIYIIIYGKNATDNTVDTKYGQLTSLGFQHVHIYSGGLFEWCLLQDIYGIDEFPTTKTVVDILRFKPAPVIFTNTPLLKHY